MTLVGLRKVLFVAPMLAAVAVAWALPGETATPVSTDGTDVVAADVTEESADVADELALAVSNCTYYNNAQHTQVVGQFGYDCCNNYVAWGKKTQFKVCGGCFICFPPPR